VAIEIRPQEDADRGAVWGVLETVVRAGDTFMNDPDSSKEEVVAGWEGPGTQNYVAELDGEVVGAYLLRPAQPGLGSHVANASFAVAPSARGHGVGRAMGEHALVEAKRLGFLAMQFNAVVSTNEPAIALWRSLGFAEVGRIPEAFRLRGEDYVDTLVMHRSL
jgi:L-amino acid N-acyltransferase YncA